MGLWRYIYWLSNSRNVNKIGTAVRLGIEVVRRVRCGGGMLYRNTSNRCDIDYRVVQITACFFGVQ
jgi:hypothetical protein